jgi:hypothetical protein
MPAEWKEIIRSNTILRRLYYRARIFRGARGQSDETRILSDLAKSVAAPKTFIEFGFHPIEFNCASLALNRDWQGLLIDGNTRQVSDARSVLPKRIEMIEAFLTLDNLDFIKSKFQRLGVLSIDVDGNDYWFLERLIDIKPSVICVEYNASFGLEPITVPMTLVLTVTKNIRAAGITGLLLRRLPNSVPRTAMVWLRFRKPARMLSSRKMERSILPRHGNRAGFVVSIPASAKTVSGRELATCRLYGFS